jgi:hypothetical protein
MRKMKYPPIQEAAIGNPTSATNDKKFIICPFNCVQTLISVV